MKKQVGLALLLLPLCAGIPQQRQQGQQHEMQHRHHQHHIDGGKCSQCPHHSDVIATSRYLHFVPIHGLDTWGAMAAFNATRMDWVYTTNASFVAQAHKRNIEITLAINPQTPDGPAIAGKTTFEVGRVLNLRGERMVAPWMGTQENYYGCVGNPDFLTIQYAFVDSLLDSGTGGIQHDDPAANGEAVTWGKGDPERGGCYCEHCISGFTAALLQPGVLNPSERALINITASFSYRELLLREPWNGTSKAVKLLRPLFVRYGTDHQNLVGPP